MFSHVPDSHQALHHHGGLFCRNGQELSKLMWDCWSATSEMARTTTKGTLKVMADMSCDRGRLHLNGKLPEGSYDDGQPTEPLMKVPLT